LPHRGRQDAACATQIRDGLRDAYARSERDDTDFGFESRRVELEQNIACYVLLDELVADHLVETFGTQPIDHLFNSPFDGVKPSRLSVGRYIEIASGGQGR
jgi:hypothetical protein